MVLSRGDVVLRDGVIAVVWSRRDDAVFVVPVEVEPSPRHRNDIGVLDAPEFVYVGLRGVPVIRPSLAAWWQDKLIVRLFELSIAAVAGLAWAMDSERFDARSAARWPGWGGVSLSEAVMLAH